MKPQQSDVSPGKSPHQRQANSSKKGTVLAKGESPLSDGQDDTQFSISHVHMQDGQFASYIVGVITNHASNKVSYAQITFGLYDRQGDKVGDALANVDDIDAHGKWKFKALVTSEHVASYKLADFTAM